MTLNLSVFRRRVDVSCRDARSLLTLRALGLLCGLLMLGGCDAAQPSSGTVAPTVQLEEFRMWMIVGERRFSITLADNEAARAFAALLPLTLDMAELNGNEKHAELPMALPTNANRPGTIRNGDLMLYGSRTLVVFYLTFESSYSYTRLGSVDEPDGLALALGRRNAQVVFAKN